MSLFKLADGRFIHASEFYFVGESDVKLQIDDLQKELNTLNSFFDEPAQEPETPAEQPQEPVQSPDPVVVPAEQVSDQPQPQVVEVNGQDVPVNQDGNIVIDPTPEPAPQPEQTLAPQQVITQLN
jgi:hypothetical protein